MTRSSPISRPSAVFAAVWTVRTFAAAVGAQSSSTSCPAVYNHTTSVATQTSLESAHQLAILARKLEETERLLHLSHSHPPNSGFRYGTFLMGVLLTLLLLGTSAFLYWEYIQQQLQRKQQTAVVGGLKDMDDSTLKKVLGQVFRHHQTFLLCMEVTTYEIHSTLNQH